VPEGALLTHTVEAVLQDLAASGATGGSGLRSAQVFGPRQLIS
jgi:hypothetical protein